MKRPLQLPLAIALALGGTNALALGLGPVHVNSRLNQPLDAEIPIIQGSAGEAEGLLVNLATAEDFDRIGLNRSRLTVPLEFSVVKGSKGESVIKVTSKEPIRDSFLDFLLEANWPKGRLLREYTVLLDPPVTAPTRSTATTAAPAVSTRPAAPPQVTRAERPASAPKPAPRVATPAAPKEAAPSRKVHEGEYGPVAPGQTLSEIARETGEGANLNQMMLALWKANPNAFYKENINALKRGAILRIPSSDEIKAIGSASEAAAQVQSQIEDWRGGRASPTLVADTGGSADALAVATPPKKSSAAKPAKPTPSERLELVPPRAGKDSMAMADRPGAGAGSPAATELKSELSRTKEALVARQQESDELKSRVKELEDIQNKNDRLIGLKNSEIAELQQKLKELQEKKGATTPAAKGSESATPVAATATPPAPSTSTSTTTATAKPAAGDKIGKQDIWGDAAATVPEHAADTAKTTTPATTPTPASSTPASTPAAESASTTTPPAAATATETPPTSTTPAAPVASTPSTPPPAVAPPPKPAAATPAKTTPKPAAKPAPAEAWYEAAWVKPAALGAGVLLLLAGLLGLRKRRTVAADAPRGSIAGAFGDSPLGDGDEAGMHAGAAEAEEAKLREQLELDPDNAGLHLELLSLYYAERDVDKFEQAAADMRDHVFDPQQPEWLEAQAMGQELAPHNPLFASAAHYDDHDTDFHADTVEHAHAPDDDDDFVFDEPEPVAPPAPVVASPTTDEYEFGLADTQEMPPAAATPEKADEGFDFDLPPLDFDTPPPQSAHNGDASPAPAPTPVVDQPIEMPAPPETNLDDGYFPGEDAIGTKLDLAKAYMDMGDPEGARSMLEEVVAEGNEAQQAEAHRLMAEIR